MRKFNWHVISVKISLAALIASGISACNQGSSESASISGSDQLGKPVYVWVQTLSTSNKQCWYKSANKDLKDSVNLNKQEISAESVKGYIENVSKSKGDAEALGQSCAILFNPNGSMNDKTLAELVKIAQEPLDETAKKPSENQKKIADAQNLLIKCSPVLSALNAFFENPFAESPSKLQESVNKTSDSLSAKSVRILDVKASIASETETAQKSSSGINKAASPVSMDQATTEALIAILRNAPSQSGAAQCALAETVLNKQETRPSAEGLVSTIAIQPQPSGFPSDISTQRASKEAIIHFSKTGNIYDCKLTDPESDFIVTLVKPVKWAKVENERMEVQFPQDVSGKIANRAGCAILASRLNTEGGRTVYIDMESWTPVK